MWIIKVPHKLLVSFELSCIYSLNVLSSVLIGAVSCLFAFLLD